MGNRIAVISWPSNQHNAVLVRAFSDFRQSIGISICSIRVNNEYTDNNCVYGTPASGISIYFTDYAYLSRLWLKRCKAFVKDHGPEGISADDIVLHVYKI